MDICERTAFIEYCKGLSEEKLLDVQNSIKREDFSVSIDFGVGFGDFSCWVADTHETDDGILVFEAFDSEEEAMAWCSKMGFPLAEINESDE